jgi:hypothetical protein
VTVQSYIQQLQKAEQVHSLLLAIVTAEEHLQHFFREVLDVSRLLAKVPAPTPIAVLPESARTDTHGPDAQTPQSPQVLLQWAESYLGPIEMLLHHYPIGTSRKDSLEKRLQSLRAALERARGLCLQSLTDPLPILEALAETYTGARCLGDELRDLDTWALQALPKVA